MTMIPSLDPTASGCTGTYSASTTLPALLAAKCDGSTCTTLQTSVTNLGRFLLCLIWQWVLLSPYFPCVYHSHKNQIWSLYSSIYIDQCHRSCCVSSYRCEEVRINLNSGKLLKQPVSRNSKCESPMPMLITQCQIWKICLPWICSYTLSVYALPPL